ncbi:MAG: hypothetical protein KHZ26_03005, partial [Haemophilus parainfluenzae]|nr:hypothetical protein [Haemophilus parainfluenzae]
VISAEANPANAIKPVSAAIWKCLIFMKTPLCYRANRPFSENKIRPILIYLKEIMQIILRCFSLISKFHIPFYFFTSSYVDFST